MDEFRRSMHIGKEAEPSTPVPNPAPASHHITKKSRSPKLPGRALLWIFFIILLSGAVGTAAYYVSRYNDSQKQIKKLSNPAEAAKAEQQQLLDKVGSLTVLPKGETPTIATVTDITKLKDQPFFASAQNGDKVLIYTQAKKAILYRPSTNKVINIAPVNLGNGQTSSGTTSTQTTTTNQNKTR